MCFFVWCVHPRANQLRIHASALFLWHWKCVECKFLWSSEFRAAHEHCFEAILITTIHTHIHTGEYLLILYIQIA